MKPAGENANWRVFRPVIDVKKCKKTYGCYAFCPENAIQIDKNGFPFIDANLCTGCLICLRECPCGAISEVKEK
ncbi:MAG: 4Fe-4S binding protein [Candidatus Aenigmarchaeota archaeon]|nr:4Fe-4S binding protein [Candidatus Aenigmarchaeota archaeon]